MVQRLCGILWAYSEAPFFVAHDIAMEEHGLYGYNSKRIMFRDFFNLKPAELWPECSEFPFNEIRIICVYNERFNVDFDVFYNTYPNQGNVIEDLEEFYIEADDSRLELVDIHKITNSSAKIIESISKKIESMNEMEIAKKYADIFWYRKKPLRDALGKDWKPPKEIYTKIEQGEIKPEIKRNPTPEDIRKEMALI